ncbi:MULTISPECIES: dihydrofolate reductase family protein [unclassified Actinotalea]|uniref:dihydrofolate reductase family protein n=1 Tax=unclassified Actinotalea TaxID=2638618 RepID=UPI0015F74121|nr:MULTISPECIES: dihydrofolate reductase family protein [unclassified Actinotalea]
MRKVVAVEFLSVDGVMQGLGSRDEDTDGGFAHGGWGAHYGGALQEVMDGSELAATTGYLFGRRTYESLAAFWPTQPDDNPMARHLNATPKHVVSRTLTHPEWAGTAVVDGDLGSAVQQLKDRGEGSITVLGSGVLVAELFRLDLVDEISLFVHPLLLGTGKRLFRGLPAPRRLQLLRSATTSAGTLAVRYAITR